MNWTPMVAQVGAWLAALGITGGVAVAAAWGLFQWLGKKWVEDHFTKELESFKAEKQVELERLKSEYGRETERLKADLNRFADRAARFHGREYDVLPEAWGLMNKAYGQTSSAVAGFQQVPSFDSMGQKQLEAWLDRCGLEEYQKDEMVASDDKQATFLKFNNWRQISDADRAVSEFSNYVILQGVFIEEVLSEKMMQAASKLRSAVISRSLSEQLQGQPYVHGQTDFWEKAINEVQAVEALVREVKEAVRARLSDIQLTNAAS